MMRPPRVASCITQPARQNVKPIECRCPPGPRQFSQKSPRLLLVSTTASLRPQLPFLYPSSKWPRGQLQNFRLFTISTSQKKFIKDTARLTVKFTVYFWAISTCFTIGCMGFLSERQERAFPSPHEWSLYTRFRFRRGKWWEIPEHNEEDGFPNWARLYAEYDHALYRLENPNKDGSGIVKQEVSNIAGVGKAGFDLTAKSEEWRQGYFEVLMGMARAAERLEGWVSDSRKRNVWSPEFIASPSNPRPKVPPPGIPLPPPPEEQHYVADPPENFYLKVLTSKGFTTSQRVTAALGYADWLSFKNLKSSAEEMYRWALDIAISGLPTPDPSATINPDTAVLNFSAPKETITPNLINAATQLGIHHAATGDISSALPIFLSVLRARRSADPAPPYEPEHVEDSSALGTLTSILSFKPPKYPPLPSTGDEPLLRSEKDQCEEASLMNYIGEILFATAGSLDQQRRHALSWVRDGVSMAKTAQSSDTITAYSERRKKCQTCEEVGLEAWGKILTYFAADAREKRDFAKSGSLKSLPWKLWGTEKLEQQLEDIEGEEEGVVMRLAKLRNQMLQEEYAEMDQKYGKVFVF